MVWPLASAAILSASLMAYVAPKLNLSASLAYVAPKLGLLQSRQDDGCKVMPSDAAWPAADVWDAFNASVDGRLIKTVPIAEACHSPSFSEEACAAVQGNWSASEYQ